MRGLFLEAGRVRYRTDLPEPEPLAGECRVEVLQAGVCATDLALLEGYMGFRGVPGHEFVGRAIDGPLAGKRVVGEINAACGRCASCRAAGERPGMERHCPHRTVLGIAGRSGAFAERLCLPAANLLEVPDSVSTPAATFTEPLAAAGELLLQLGDVRGQAALVIGDGRLGLLCAQVLAQAGARTTIAGRHPERAELLSVPCEHVVGMFEAEPCSDDRRFDLVVEASGHAALLQRALARVLPRGTLALKTTSAQSATLDLSPLVIDEITLLGSRCGPFAPALDLLASGRVEVEPFIQAVHPLEEGAAGLLRAGEPGVLKVLIAISDHDESR